MIFLTSIRNAVKSVYLIIACAMFAATGANADQNCNRVDAYWATNFSKLVQNLRDCDTRNWQKCSQAAAIHYDLNTGSLHQRARACGLSKPTAPGIDFTSYLETDSAQCMSDRDTLRHAFEVRAQARIACAAARVGGDDQEWLNAQCSYYRSQMANYHTPFHKMSQSCRINYREVLALR